MLGRLPGTNVFRNVKQYSEAQQYPGILTVRIDAPLYYANVPVRLCKSESFRMAPSSAVRLLLLHRPVHVCLLIMTCSVCSTACPVQA